MKSSYEDFSVTFVVAERTEASAAAPYVPPNFVDGFPGVGHTTPPGTLGLLS